MAKKVYEAPHTGDIDFIPNAEGDGFLRQLWNQLYNSNANWNRVRAKGMSGVDEAGAEEALKKMFAEQQAFGASPLKTKVDLGGGKTGNALKNTLGAVGANIKAHPVQAAGLGALGVANIAGLTDDDKIGGQLVGGLAGGVIPALMGANPTTAIALGLGGGTLGSLFDKLRAKKEAEQKAVYQEQSY